jgi:hypothetical protein
MAIMQDQMLARSMTIRDRNISIILVPPDTANKSLGGLESNQDPDDPEHNCSQDTEDQFSLFEWAEEDKEKKRKCYGEVEEELNPLVHFCFLPFRNSSSISCRIFSHLLRLCLG